MTGRQIFLKFLYPAFNRISKLFGKNINSLSSTTMAKTSFYDLCVTLNNGKQLSFSELKNKKVLVVNTASDCGYTAQYEGLQALHEKYMNKLVVIGFPANDFGAQERGSDELIEEFCKVNFGVTFPLAKKSTVIKNADQNAIFQWLTDDNKNGWNYVAPSWNFCKYLIDEQGNLINFFESGVEPMGPEIAEAVNV